MGKEAGSAGANTGLLVGAVVFAAAAIGTGVYLGNQQGGAVSEGTEPVAMQQPLAGVPEASEPTTEQSEPEVVADAGPTPPTIDEVRVEEDGLTIVAGRAAPGSVISIQLDGVENTTVEVDGSGSFAAVTVLEPNDDAQVLSLVQSDGKEQLASLDEVILAPVIVPNVVAGAENESVVEPTVNAVPNEQDSGAAESLAKASDVPDSDGTVVAEDTDTVADAPTIVADADAATSGTDVNASSIAGTNEQSANADETVASDQVPDPLTNMADLSGQDALSSEVAGLSATTDTRPALDGTQTALSSGQPDSVNAPNVDTSQADPLPELPVTATTEVASVDTPEATTEQSPASVQSVEQPQFGATQAQPELSVQATADAAPQGTTDTPGRVAVLRSTEEGVELLGRQAVIQDNVALDTISYSAEGDVQLAGRAKQSSEAVRIYLNNKVIATLEVDPDGRWRGKLPEVDTGVYTLRVDEVSADGEVTSRIQTPFKREDPAVLEAARSEAGRNAKRVTVQAGDTLWAISRDRYGEGLLYVQVFEANKGSIRNPDLIFPGQVFDLPE